MFPFRRKRIWIFNRLQAVKILDGFIVINVLFQSNNILSIISKTHGPMVHVVHHMKEIQHYLLHNSPWTRHFNTFSSTTDLVSISEHIVSFRSHWKIALHFSRHLPLGHCNWTTASTKHSLHEPVKMPTEFFFHSTKASYKYASIWKVTVGSFPPWVHMVPVFMGWWGLLLGFRVVIIWGMLQLQ